MEVPVTSEMSARITVFFPKKLFLGIVVKLMKSGETENWYWEVGSLLLTIPEDVVEALELTYWEKSEKFGDTYWASWAILMIEDRMLVQM